MLDVLLHFIKTNAPFGQKIFLINNTNWKIATFINMRHFIQINSDSFSYSMALKLHAVHRQESYER